ncbi:Bacterioferritin [Symmachiella dynata]|uniref:bacterioferritin n=1 Tax=Symmachiella dynata TaxID=2527995 RepID=UPI00118BCD75|nr:bacterioferritin [Symmachiella dynata]QDT47246.1 Bacterioferritin [Symmachiella dynata]
MAKKQSIKNLQTALSMELTAAHQYQLHAGVLDDWGMTLLATQMREEMQEELGHSQEFMSRIMFLKGDPEMKMAKPPVRALSLKEMFESDLVDEKEAITFYTKSSLQAVEEGDLGSRAIFERIALDEEQHMSWLELQLDLLERMGESAYISKHIPSPGSSEQLA